MQKKTIQKQLIQITGRNETLCYLSTRAKEQADIGNFLEYETVMEELLVTYRKAEREARGLLLHSAFKDKYKVLDMIADAMEITVELEAEGWYKIGIPAIVPKKISGYGTDFIAQPLAHMLDQYVLLNAATLVPIRYAVICFRDVFDRNSSQHLVRDSDNIEYKKLLDVVAERLLRDDNGLYCDTVHQAVPGDAAHTEIYVIPEELFSLWREHYPKIR